MWIGMSLLLSKQYVRDKEKANWTSHGRGTPCQVGSRTQTGYYQSPSSNASTLFPALISCLTSSSAFDAAQELDRADESLERLILINSPFHIGLEKITAAGPSARVISFPPLWLLPHSWLLWTHWIYTGQSQFCRVEHRRHA